MYNRFAGDMDAAVSRLITPRINQEVKVVFGQTMFPASGFA
jgi:hypothetical protein